MILKPLKSAFQTHYQLLLIGGGFAFICLLTGFAAGYGLSDFKHRIQQPVVVTNSAPSERVVLYVQAPAAEEKEVADRYDSLPLGPVTKMVEGIKVETYPRNSELEVFHLRKYVGEEMFAFTRTKGVSEEVFDDTKTNKDLISALLKMEGIEEIRADEYRLTITKAKAFEWTEVQPKIIAILKAFEAGNI